MKKRIGEKGRRFEMIRDRIELKKRERDRETETEREEREREEKRDRERERKKENKRTKLGVIWFRSSLITRVIGNFSA